MIKINRKTSEVTGTIDAEKAWKKIVEYYFNNTSSEENEEETKNE